MRLSTIQGITKAVVCVVTNRGLNNLSSYENVFILNERLPCKQDGSC